MEETNIIALEIGSSKIKGALGSVDSAGILSVKAVEEEHISDIVRYGCIRNVVETANAVKGVIQRLEARVAPRKVERVYLSIGGRSLSAVGVNIERRYAYDTEITNDTIMEITDEALGKNLPDRTVVAALPRETRVDNAPAPKPVGMFGRNITVSLNLLSCRTQLIKNLTHVIEERLGLKIAEVAVRPLAQADLVLLADEKKLGCMFVDFGAETTTVAIYRQGALVHLAVLPMGSRNITRDITTLNILEDKAEELKITFGNALPGGADQVLRPADGTDINMVNNYVSARVGEILLNVVEQIKYAGLTPEKLPRGIVVTGRGARLGGFITRLGQMLPGMNVRVGTPGNKVRILDGRIHADDAVDVISILYDAARRGAQESLSPAPRPVVQPQPQPQPEPVYRQPAAQQPAAQQPVAQQPVYQPAAQQPVYQPAAQQPAAQPAAQPAKPAPQPVRATAGNAPKPQPAPQPKAPKKPNPISSLFGSIRDRVADLLTDNLYEDDDDDRQ